MNPLTVLAETTETVTTFNTAGDKAQMVMIVLAAAAISLSIFGFSYMNALGRNPEAGKSAGPIPMIIAAMIELTALLAFIVVVILK